MRIQLPPRCVIDMLTGVLPCVYLVTDDTMVDDRRNLAGDFDCFLENMVGHT